MALHCPLLARVALALALVGACQSKESKGRSEPPPAEPPSAMPAEATPAEGLVRPRVNFKIDGKKNETVQLGEETILLSLPFLPAIEEWKLLIVRNIDDREFRATKPSMLTGQRTMKIIKGEDESFEFVVMQLEGHGETIRHRMPKVKVVEIHTHDYSPPPPSARSKSIAIKIAGETRILDRSALEAIQRTPEPGSKKKRDTWLILDFLGKKSLTSEESIILRAPDDEEQVLTSSDLADDKAQHMIKRNRRGQFHYRSWRLTEPPNRATELRSIFEIEVR
jgi:hypothetical protein